MYTSLTTDDVAAAYYAFQLGREARTEETTPEAMIHELANTAAEAREQLATYARGVALLKDYTVLISDRSVVGGRFENDDLARIVSPTIRVHGGHIATSEAYRAVALAQR